MAACYVLAAYFSYLITEKYEVQYSSMDTGNDPILPTMLYPTTIEIMTVDL